MAQIDLAALFATTKERISRKLFDGISERIPLVAEIKASGNLKEVVDGGRQFSEPAITEDSAATGAYEGTDTLDVSQQGGIQKYVYTPAFIFGSVFMAGTELAMNAGDQQAVNLLEGRIEQMRMSKFNKLDSFLMGAQNDGTTNQGAWIGIRDIISNDNTTTIPGTGVDRSTAANVKTRNQVENTAVASATAWNTNNVGRTKMTNLYLSCSFGNERPRLGIFPRTVFSAYSISLQANERFVEIKRSANGGFPFLTFMIDLKVTFADNILAGSFYFVNTNFFKLKILKNKNFKMSDFLRQYNADVESALCTTGGQLTSGAPRYSGVGDNIGF